MEGAVVEARRVPENDAGGAVDPGVADRVHESVQVVEEVSASRRVAISPAGLLGEFDVKKPWLVGDGTVRTEFPASREGTVRRLLDDVVLPRQTVISFEPPLHAHSPFHSNLSFPPLLNPGNLRRHRFHTAKPVISAWKICVLVFPHPGILIIVSIDRDFLAPFIFVLEAVGEVVVAPVGSRPELLADVEGVSKPLVGRLVPLHARPNLRQTRVFFGQGVISSGFSEGKVAIRPELLRASPHRRPTRSPLLPVQDRQALEVFIGYEFFDVLPELSHMLLPSAELRNSSEQISVSGGVVVGNPPEFVVVEDDDFIARLKRLVRIRRDSVFFGEVEESAISRRNVPVDLERLSREGNRKKR